MSRKYKTTTREVTIAKALVEVKCDVCGSTAEYPDFHPDPAWAWGSVGYSGATFKYWYSMDGDCTEYEFDLCPDCGEILRDQIEKKNL